MYLNLFYIAIILLCCLCCCTCFHFITLFFVCCNRAQHNCTNCLIALVQHACGIFFRILLSRTLSFNPGALISILSKCLHVVGDSTDKSLSAYLWLSNYPNTGHNVTFVSLAKFSGFVRFGGCKSFKNHRRSFHKQHQFLRNLLFSGGQ